MDVFKFTNPTNPTKMEQGKIVSGFKSKMWIERYVKEGEFKFVAPADSGIRDILPIGTFISHLNSTEIMIVENHEINDNKDKESDITITGRGFETFFENRIVGSNVAYPFSGTIADYALLADYTWNQVVQMISDHILAANLLDDNNALDFVSVITTVPGVGVSTARAYKFQDLLAAIQDIFKVDDLGIKIIRPGTWSPLGASPNLAVVIHQGVDRSSEVIFSYDTGEITSADYLWSNKKLKNSALVTGKWVETLITPGGEIGYNRRVMHVDASDIDKDQVAAPAGATLTTIVAAMQQRGIEALAAQNDVALTKAEISKEATRSVYRNDFDVGDLITVSGDYNEVSTMRISEYVEIEDEKGESGYPTLTMDQ